MSYNQPRSHWDDIEDAALNASYEEPDVLERNLGTPYLFCTHCDKRQEADFALDGSGIPYCTICGELYPGVQVEWEEPEPEPLTAQERKLISTMMEVYGEHVQKSADFSDEQKEGIDRMIQSIFEKLRLS